MNGTVKSNGRINSLAKTNEKTIINNAAKVKFTVKNLVAHLLKKSNIDESFSLPS